MGYAADTVLVGEFPVLSLSLTSSEDNISVIDAQPISYSLPRYSSSSTTTCDSGEDGPFKAHTHSVSTSFWKHLNCFQTNWKKYLLLRIRCHRPPLILCLSLPYTPDTTITTLHRSVGSSQHSSAKRSLFRETGDDKFVPAKVRKHSTPNNPKRPQAVVSVAAAAGEGEGKGEEEDHWIVKPLTKTDVNGASRLLLGRQDVKNYVLPFMKEEEQAVICNELRGVDVKVYDMDTQTEHILNLRKWATNSFQLVKAWTSEFVKRRNLKEDDVIWIRWDKNNYRFCFRVHMRNGVFAV
ncbi:hypothetical protein P3S68_000806 [Capsicum galapagoense]